MLSSSRATRLSGRTRTGICGACRDCFVSNGSFGSTYLRLHKGNDCMLMAVSQARGTRADVTFGRPSTTEDHVYAPASYTVLMNLCSKI